MSAVLSVAIAALILAVWVVFGNLDDGLSETWDIVFGVAAGIFAGIAIFLSFPRTRR